MEATIDNTGTGYLEAARDFLLAAASAFESDPRRHMRIMGALVDVDDAIRPCQPLSDEVRDVFRVHAQRLEELEREIDLADAHAERI